MKTLQLVAGTLIALAPIPAAAVSLAGATVSEVYRTPDIATTYGGASYAPATFVVGAGVESVVNIEDVTTIGVNFASHGLGLLFNTVLNNPTWNAAAFNGLVFTAPEFASVASFTVLPTTTFAGFDASRVSIVGNELRLDWNGLSYQDGTRVDLAMTFVPEPETWLMLVIGFGAIGLGMRQRRVPENA